MKKSIILVASLLALASCEQKEKMGALLSESGSDRQAAEVVLQERISATTPLLFNKDYSLDAQSSPVSKSNDAPAEVTDFRGCSHLVRSSIVSDPENMSFQVVDIDLIRAEESDLLQSHRELSVVSEEVAYASFDRYPLVAPAMSYYGGDLPLNAAQLARARERDMERQFGTLRIPSKDCVFGEIDVQVRRGRHLLNASQGTLKRIAGHYLNRSFVYHLYNNSIHELISNYGAHVVMSYFSGGRASFFYLGQYAGSNDEQSKEATMRRSLDASYGWKDGDKTASLRFGGEYGNPLAYPVNIWNLFASLRTTGGYTLRPAFSAINIASIACDLAPWINSFSDVANPNHSVAGIDKGGLLPLSNFVLEENFSRRISDTYKGVLPESRLREPKIVIQKMFVRANDMGEALYAVVPVLITRMGDCIVLSDGSEKKLSDDELRLNNNYDVFMTKSTQLAAQKGMYFGLQITADAEAKINPLLRNPLVISLDEIDEGRMKRFQHPKTGGWYIFDSVKRYAFSLGMETEYITMSYGIESWFDAMPQEDLLLGLLINAYRIVGL